MGEGELSPTRPPTSDPGGSGNRNSRIRIININRILTQKLTDQTAGRGTMRYNPGRIGSMNHSTGHQLTNQATKRIKQD